MSTDSKEESLTLLKLELLPSDSDKNAKETTQNDADPMEEINALKEQLAQKEDEIFELLAERVTVQAEAKQQLEAAGQEHAQQIRLLQEQLRRLQQEANLANSKILQLQKKLTESNKNPQIPQETQQELQLVTPTNAGNLGPPVVEISQPIGRSLARLIQMVLLPLECSSELQYMFLREKGEGMDLLWFLVERCVRYMKRPNSHKELLGALRLFHSAMCRMDEMTRCRLVRICSGPGESQLQSNNNNIRRIRGVDSTQMHAARIRLLDPHGTCGASTFFASSTNNIPPSLFELAQYFRKHLFKEVLNFEEQNDSLELALAAVLVIHELVTHINFSEPLWKPWWADFAEQDLITLWCKQAKLLTPGRPRRICYIAELDCGKIDQDDDEHDLDSTGQEAKAAVVVDEIVVMRSLEWLTRSLDLITFFWERHPLPDRNNFWFHVDSQNAKKVTTAILDSLEYFFIPRMDQMCHGDNMKSGMWDFFACCVTWFASLLNNDQSILLLCTQMATTKTSATTWHRGMSATGVLVTVLHKIVMVQLKDDHLFPTVRQSVPLNPYRDIIIRYLHGLLMAVQSHRRFAEKQGQEPQILESFSGLLWECRDLYLGASALLLATNPSSSSCRVSDEIRTLLRLQMDELSLDETEQEEIPDDEMATST